MPSAAPTLVSPIDRLQLPYDRDRLEDIGFMTCMTLVLLGNGVAAVVLPIVLEIIRELKLERIHRDIPKAVVTAMWWGTSIGSIATLGST